MDEITKGFATLFQGRTDVYGSWEGGCVKGLVDESRFVKHLWGQEYIGIYPLCDTDTVSWGCSDIDVDVLDQARNIQLALKLKNITSWVERTVKGFHVWVFAAEPMPAWIMRRALLAAHNVAKVPAKEINPKQEVSLGYGNYVRLPYPGYLFEPASTRYIMDGDHSQATLEAFVTEALQHRTTEAELRPLADMYVPKKPAKLEGFGSAIPIDIASTLIGPYSLAMLTNGPLPGSDRSTTLYKLAHRLREDGLEAEVTYSVLLTADMRWGKFYDRGDAEVHLSKMVADVYGE